MAAGIAVIAVFALAAWVVGGLQRAFFAAFHFAVLLFRERHVDVLPYDSLSSPCTQL